MTGSRRLTWVTALTVASLLLGGGALNALAEGRGHGDGGQAKPEHQQKDKSAEGGEAAVVQLAPKVHPNPAHDSVKHKDEDNVNQNADVDRKNGGDDDEDLVTPPARVTNEERPGLGCGDKN